MIRQKKYKLLEQLLKIKVKSNFSLESFLYKSKNNTSFLTKVASKILESFFNNKNLSNKLKYPSFFKSNINIQNKTVFLKKNSFILTTFLNTEYFFNNILIFFFFKKEINLISFLNTFVITYV